MTVPALVLRSTNVLLFAPFVPLPANSKLLYLKKGSIVNSTDQLITIVLVALVLAAVAVIKDDVVPVTVGVPATLAPLILKPVGRELAPYDTVLPEALVALNSTLLIASSTERLYVVLSAGLTHVTTSWLTVRLNNLSVS